MDQIRAMAAEGLNFANNDYDRERYSRLLEIVSRMYGSYLDAPDTTIVARLQKELGACTPKIGVNVAIPATSGRLLVLQRADDKKWCLPCGWVTVGESVDDTAVRETLEETGLHIHVQGTIDLLMKGPTENQFLHHQLNLLMLSELVEEQPVMISDEHEAYQWIEDPNEWDWHPAHLEHATCALAFINNPGSAKLQLSTVASQNFRAG
jgi:8-oxo-dGTP pyrophosphatase MutT (NUDIX family)